jgi:hypothetical protein
MVQRRDSAPQIKDLFEFYNQWLFLRPEIVDLIASGRLSERETIIIKLMMELIDRVGPRDLDRR